MTGGGARLADRPVEVFQAGVELMLSGRCNLACAYCYQDRRLVRRSIRWVSIRAALDAALSRGFDAFWVEFSGGEPLLEPDLMRRAVAYLEERRGSSEVSYALTTNGTLLTRELLDFVVEHDFMIRLSFDGVAAAQDLRSSGTFAVLDRLLDLLRREHPTYLRDNVTVGMTLLAQTIPHLAESVRYLISKGVADIGLSPLANWELEWHAAARAELQEQVDEVLDLSLEHWRRTGLVPVQFLSGAPVRDSTGPVTDLMCGAVDGRAMVVDPDGRAWACPIFASSMRALPPLGAEASRAFALGDVSAPALAGRLRGLPAKARALGIFTAKHGKRSSYGACAECRFVADCHVCPASICHIPGNRDPDLIPDFQCAFNQVTLGARQRFDELTEGRASAAWYAGVRTALHELGEAIKASSGQTRSTSAGRGRQSARGRRSRRAT